jgi:hypothetical protein
MERKIEFIAIMFVTTLCCTVFGVVTLHGQHCEKLENGSYRFKPRTKGYVEYELRITGNDFVSHFIPRPKERKWVSETDTKGKIEWKSDCIFILTPEKTSATDSLNFLKRIPKDWGELCVELNGFRKYRVTYTGNLEITTCKGRIVKD